LRASIAFFTLFTLWALRASVTFGASGAGGALGTALALFTLRANRAGRTHWPGVTFRPLWPSSALGAGGAHTIKGIILAIAVGVFRFVRLAITICIPTS
jgi:hypothetical protein